jgi:hypothetical protein
MAVLFGLLSCITLVNSCTNGGRVEWRLRAPGRLKFKSRLHLISYLTAVSFDFLMADGDIIMVPSLCATHPAAHLSPRVIWNSGRHGYT